jgi:hypothetical protein
MSTLALLNTRIAGFKVSPQLVAVGDPVTITGRLEYYNPVPIPGIGGWRPLAGKTVKLIVNYGVVDETTTGGSGEFTFRYYPRHVGDYWIKVRYDPTGFDAVLYKPCESQEVRVTAVTPEEKQRRDLVFWGLIAGGVAAAIATAVAVITRFAKK